jgi:hypothetical protein
MKQIIVLAFITISVAITASGQVERNPIKVKGEVVAYIKPNIIVRTGAHNGEMLIAKVKFPRTSKTEHVWLLNEFFGNVSNLPAKVFSDAGKWKFKLNRRVDCDSVLRPNYSEIFKDFQKTRSNNETWVMDEPAEINFIIPEKSLNIPANKVLPCYEILSLK